MRAAVLISGGGSNLQSIIDHSRAGRIDLEICAVISNVDGVRGLERAREAGIDTQVIKNADFENREAFDHALIAALDPVLPDVVILAGFMRILTPSFVDHYRGRMLNIHPSLLPAFPGLDTHRRVLESGRSEHGASVHFVTADMDGGPVIAQARIRVEPDDTPDTLAARVLEQEHRLYPLVIHWFTQGRLDEDSRDGARLDGNPLTEPVDIAGIEALPC